MIIDRICWVSIKKRLNNFDFILINSWSVNNCGFIEKGISCSWKVGRVKEVMESISNCCAAATTASRKSYLNVWYWRWLNPSLSLVRYLISIRFWQVNTLFSRSLTNCNNLSLSIWRLVKLWILRSSLFH